MKKMIYSSLAFCFVLNSSALMADVSSITPKLKVAYCVTKTSENKVNTPINRFANQKKADLVVSEIKKLGKIKFSRHGNVIKVPIRITIKNNGKSTARSFKVATEIFNPRFRSYYHINFHAFGYPSSRPTVNIHLEPGESTSIYGKLWFAKSYQGRNIRIRVKADACARWEKRESYCRVRESNEKNNYSQTIRIVMPKRSI